ncbi:hypothetical protein [Actinomadura rugatobispora]|uniref:DUF4132 domain-containing protein n=1 Tax=Actinomadura rugatobispora TaxID=1994 RepID=A0ABW0ZXI4_9ACTN
MTTPSPHQPALAALAANADPRKAKSGVTKLARPLPAADVPPLFEQACREFGAAGEGELATWAFGEARKVEKKHPALRDMDVLHAAFLEFTPRGAVAPGALRDHVKLMGAELAADEAHDRFWEILEAAFAVGLVPYARVFPDLLGLAKAAGVKKGDAEARLAERLLRTGVLPAASHAIWRAARRPLGRIAAADRALLDLLLAAEPDEDADLAAEIRQYWLEALAEADAGAHVPPEWFFTSARRCSPEVLLRLVDQAPDRLAGTPPHRPAEADLGDPGVPPPGGSVYIRRSKTTSFANRVDAPSWRAGKTDFEALAAELQTGPGERHAFEVQVDLFVQDLGHYGNVDYREALRAFCSVPALRDLLRDLVEGWKARAASGSLPELDHALTRLVPLAEAGYADFGTGLRLPDPRDALSATLRGGLPAELAHPPMPHGSAVRVLQHGELLTWTARNGDVHIVGPGGRAERRRGPDLNYGVMTWYDGENAYSSRYVDHVLQTFRLEDDPAAGPVLTLDEATRYSRPQSPASAEVTFPGAPGPARVAYARGGITVTAHDGTVTALLPYSAEKLRGTGPEAVPPPGWWAHLEPADPDGSAVLRGLGREQAERLLDAAFTGPLAAAEAVDPRVTSVRLREEIAEAALTAVQCLYRLVRLRDILGLEPQPALPEVLRTRPDLPVVRSLPLVPRFRRLAELMEDAAARPRGEHGHPIAVAGDLAFVPPLDFGLLGKTALAAARPWQTGRRAANLETLHAWASTPLGDGGGRWRRLALAWTGAHPHTRDLELWRTPNGALIFGHHYYRPDWSDALEYSPDGAFGPVDMPGWEIKGRAKPQGWGGADRVAEFERLLDERGPVPQNPDWARELAEAAGIALIDAATICFGQWSRQEPAEIPEEIRDLFTDPADPGKLLPWTLPYPKMDAVAAPLMPDDPAALWDRGPDIARAAVACQEFQVF